ncbi:MAG: ABC transporter ATP-binding protein [Salinigranum sp.]
MASDLLELAGVTAGYNGNEVLTDVSLGVPEGEVVTLLGRNGAGKTTTLRTAVGLLPVMSGTVTFDGVDVTESSPHEVYRQGGVLVPEDRGMFPGLTVYENLEVPIVSDDGDETTIEEVFELFPRLAERRSVDANNLSGGEQQMLAIARALRAGPKLLLLDEPSEGLAPQIVAEVADTVRSIAARGTTILLVEQNVRLAFELAEYCYVIDSGRIVLDGPSDEIRADEEAVGRYLGVKRRA